jgi:hypothetical protein
MADLDLTSLHPRRIVGSILTDDDPSIPGPLPAAPVAVLAPGERPPYDLDAT